MTAAPDAEVRAPVAAAAERPVESALERARAAQPEWAACPIEDRCRVLRRFRSNLAGRAEEIGRWVSSPWRRNPLETLAAEALSLLDACRYVEKNAARLLRPRRPPGSRPMWLGPLSLEQRREPHGAVLILGPANYPLFLPGVQTLQALAAGNAVLWKPGRFGATAAERIGEALEAAGLPQGLLEVLPEDPAAGEAAIRAGVDRIVLTGSADTGRQVLTVAADKLTPVAAELSGSDACFVLESAALDRVERALRFGLAWNRGGTCIAPRRVFISSRRATLLAERLRSVALEGEAVELIPEAQSALREAIVDAESRGARRLGREWPQGAAFPATVLAGVAPGSRILNEAPFAPLLSIVPVDNMDQALEIDAACPYALGASIFGETGEAQELALRVNAGVVTVNDLIAPTADPRLAFGGRKRSGFGVTRGAEGLLEMTRPKTVVTRRGNFLAHLDEPRPEEDRRMCAAYMEAAHGRALGARLRAAGRLMATLIARVK